MKIYYLLIINYYSYLEKTTNLKKKQNKSLKKFFLNKNINKYKKHVTELLIRIT